MGGGVGTWANVGSMRVALLKEAAPKISRVGILANRSNALEANVHQATVPTAQALRLTFLPVEVSGPSDFDRAFAVLIRERAHALLATENPLNVDHRGSIVSFAAGNRLPTVFGERAFVDAGGLMSYGISYADLLQRLPTYMDKILRGAKPADLPVEQPTKFELVINLKTAKALGLNVTFKWRHDVDVEADQFGPPEFKCVVLAFDVPVLLKAKPEPLDMRGVP